MFRISNRSKSFPGTARILRRLTAVFLFLLTAGFLLHCSASGIPVTGTVPANGISGFRKVLHSAALPASSARRIESAGRIQGGSARQNRSWQDYPEGIIASRVGIPHIIEQAAGHTVLYRRLHCSAGVPSNYPARASPVFR